MVRGLSRVGEGCEICLGGGWWGGGEAGVLETGHGGRVLWNEGVGQGLGKTVGRRAISLRDNSNHSAPTGKRMMTDDLHTTTSDQF